MKILSLDEAKHGLRLLANAGMQKLNISGGEPFLQPKFIGEIFRFCKEELHLESCSVVNNGSKVTRAWLDEYGRYLDVMAISCDSFNPEVNLEHGRREKRVAPAKHVQRVFQVADWCRERNIKVKINSVITRCVVSTSCIAVDLMLVTKAQLAGRYERVHRAACPCSLESTTTRDLLANLVADHIC
jgi:radical S-adenosyl methionine domain-containing protein 2